MMEIKRFDSVDFVDEVVKAFSRWWNKDSIPSKDNLFDVVHSEDGSYYLISTNSKSKPIVYQCTIKLKQDLDIISHLNDNYESLIAGADRERDLLIFENDKVLHIVGRKYSLLIFERDKILYAVIDRFLFNNLNDYFGLNDLPSIVLKGREFKLIVVNLNELLNRIHPDFFRSAEY